MDNQSDHQTIKCTLVNSRNFSGIEGWPSASSPGIWWKHTQKGSWGHSEPFGNTSRFQRERGGLGPPYLKVSCEFYLSKGPFALDDKQKWVAWLPMWLFTLDYDDNIYRIYRQVRTSPKPFKHCKNTVVTCVSYCCNCLYNGYSCISGFCNRVQISSKLGFCNRHV